MGLGPVISDDSANSTPCDHIPIVSVSVCVCLCKREREFVCLHITEENSKVLV